jgi:hypothetical protein
MWTTGALDGKRATDSRAIELMVAERYMATLYVALGCLNVLGRY